jgi:hypothetical protein
MENKETGKLNPDDFKGVEPVFFIPDGSYSSLHKQAISLLRSKEILERRILEEVDTISLSIDASRVIDSIYECVASARNRAMEDGIADVNILGDAINDVFDLCTLAKFIVLIKDLNDRLKRNSDDIEKTKQNILL